MGRGCQFSIFGDDKGVNFWDKGVIFWDKGVNFWDRGVNFWDEGVNFWDKGVNFWDDIVNFSDEMSIWDHSVWIIPSGSFLWDRSFCDPLGSFLLGSVGIRWDHSFGIIPLGSFLWGIIPLGDHFKGIFRDPQ